MHPSCVNPLSSTTHNHPPMPSTLSTFIGLAAISITSAKPSLIIGLLEAIEAAAAMRRAHPHALSGGCRRSLARDSGIIVAVQDDAEASSSMLREEVSVKHSQLMFWCRYAGGEPTRRAMEASEGRLHQPRPPSFMACNFSSSLTQAWCALTRSGQVDSRANRRRQRQCLLMPPVVGAPSEGDFQAEGEARMKMKPKAYFQPLTPFQSPRSIPKGPDPKTHFQSPLVPFVCSFPGPFSKSLLLLHGYHFQAHF